MPRHVLVKELDLRTGHTFNTVNNTLNAVPGFKTSAAFFSFLRANLVLPPSTLNSTSSTPLLDPSSSGTLPPLHPSSLATMTSIDDVSHPTNHLADIPPSQPDPSPPTLKLVADSIAQQRQAASRAMIFHPLTIAVYIAIVALTSQFIYKSSSDAGILVTTLAGVTMTCLIAVRGFTSGYLTLAEELNWGWIRNEDGEEDVVIGSRYGEELIGACVLRLERNGNGGGKKKAKGGRGIVRAWTVRIRYRGGGVGTELLEEAVKFTREKFGKEAEIGFAAEHANSKMILPEIFNGGFRKRERRAAGALEHVLESLDGKKKR
ncbi:hypothetical protein D0Z07_0340 [Hyphodiscus hymeniophilus]|uniref:N-acetyltransferase domain-containing protein n=1 Tax=Hyphodiscus hymeniophilus TaxID=353542 RepID=A0A9P6VRY7_9HELO|nr:hypothetical protein D0Z07_0340 [Hyphodiscus hymeniophilus]